MTDPSSSKHGEEELPFRASIELRLIDLIDGRITGDEAAAWARPFVADDRARAQDPSAWETLKSLSGAAGMDRDDSETVRGWLEVMRAAPAERYPRRIAVERRLEALIAGRITPEEADEWAMPFVAKDDEYPDVTDKPAWEALSFLSGCDMKDSNGDYLSGPASWKACLDALRR